MELEPEPEPERVAAGAFAPLRKRLAKLDADYKLSEKAAAASKIAAERAAAAAAAAAAGATQAAVAVENYRKGVAPLPPDIYKQLLLVVIPTTHFQSRSRRRPSQ